MVFNASMFFIASCISLQNLLALKEYFIPIYSVIRIPRFLPERAALFLPNFLTPKIRYRWAPFQNVSQGVVWKICLMGRLWCTRGVQRIMARQLWGCLRRRPRCARFTLSQPYWHSESALRISASFGFRPVHSCCPFVWFWIMHKRSQWAA